MKLSTDTKIIAAVAGLVLLAAWWAARRLADGGAATFAGEAARGAVGAVGSAATGAIVGVGEWVGVPATNVDQCRADLAAGRWWDASFSCPARDFVGGVWSSSTAQAAAVRDAERTLDPLRDDPFRGMAPTEWAIYTGQSPVYP